MAHLVREGLDRPADVVREQAERVGDLRRELPDPQLAVEEDRADVGAGQEVVHVVGELGQLGDLALVLGVDRVELLVDALQLLVRALELFVRRLQLLVRGLELLVARFELLDRSLEAFFGGAQLGLERGELPLRYLIDVDLNGGGDRERGTRLRRFERDQDMGRAVRTPGDRSYRHTINAIVGVASGRR